MAGIPSKDVLYPRVEVETGQFIARKMPEQCRGCSVKQLHCIKDDEFSMLCPRATR